MAEVLYPIPVYGHDANRKREIQSNWDSTGKPINYTANRELKNDIA